MSEKSYVALEAAVCPVCDKEHTYNCGILFDTRLKDSFDKRYVVTHVALCEEHQKKVDEGYYIFLEIDFEKSKIKDGTISPEDAYRTGNYAFVPKNFANEVLNVTSEKGLVYISTLDMDALKKLVSNKTED